MRSIKKHLAVLLAACLLSGLLPGGALAEDAAAELSLDSGDVNITAPGTYKIMQSDPGTPTANVIAVTADSDVTLILAGVNINAREKPVISADCPSLTLIIEAESRLSSRYDDSVQAYAVKNTGGSLAVSGGTLHISVTGGVNNNHDATGVYVKGNFENSAILDISAERKSLSAVSSNAFALYALGCTSFVNSGTLELAAQTINGSAYGISLDGAQNLTFSNGVEGVIRAEVTALGGKAEGFSGSGNSNYACGISIIETNETPTLLENAGVINLTAHNPGENSGALEYAAGIVMDCNGEATLENSCSITASVTEGDSTAINIQTYGPTARFVNSGMLDLTATTQGRTKTIDFGWATEDFPSSAAGIIVCSAYATDQFPQLVLEDGSDIHISTALSQNAVIDAEAAKAEGRLVAAAVQRVYSTPLETRPVQVTLGDSVKITAPEGGAFTSGDEDDAWIDLLTDSDGCAAPSATLQTLSTRPAAPVGPEGVAVSHPKRSDGLLVHVDNTMEYYAEGQWNAITGNAVAGLPFGDYPVRYAATGSSLASESTVLTVYAAPVPTVSITDLAADGAKLAGSVAAGTEPYGYRFEFRTAGGSEWSLLDSGDTSEQDKALELRPSGLTPDTKYEARLTVTYGGNKTAVATGSFRTLSAAPTLPTGSITGNVTNGTGAVCDITVTIEEGNTVLASQTLADVANGGDSAFAFASLPDGYYNVVADNGQYRVTSAVHITDGAAVIDVNMALGKRQSVVKIATPDTPPAAVDGLPLLFEQKAAAEEEGYTDANEAVVNSGGTVELELRVEKQEADSVAGDAAAIAALPDAQPIALYLDLTVSKTVLEPCKSPVKTPITSLPQTVTVTIPIPVAAQGKQNITVYQVHGGTALALPKADPGGGGEWAEVDGGVLHLHIRRFSTYAVGYTEAAPDVSYTPPKKKPLPFIDVKTDDWFYEGVRYVYEKGLMSGTAGDSFSPHLDTTRGTIATILWRLEGSPIPKAPVPFPDVEAGSWYTDAAVWCEENGIFIGYSDGRFGGEDIITREQLAAVLWRYARHKGMDVSAGEDTNILSYPDAFSVSPYALSAMQWACGAGLIKGGDANLLSPQGKATRAETSEIIMRYGKKEQKRWAVFRLPTSSYSPFSSSQ